MLEPVQTIGRYRIRRALGQGAMGVVYLAEDPLLKRRVAIKAVRAEGEERARALEWFRREAEISAQLNHPNIVTVYDVGEEPGVGPFITMEYVEGNNLGQFIREGSLETETKFSILIQAMHALRAAHRHAIVHRDIKPENILVTENGRVKLTDFGIAKTMAPQQAPSGEFLGSPAYSAPELLRGAEPTPSSDGYGFAVTAFELLTGRLPHPGAHVAAVISHALTEPPEFPQGMSGDIAKVFRQALAADPEERPVTLMEFLVPLVAAWPLDPPARDRIAGLFQQDDYAGDILPIRRLRVPDYPWPAPRTVPAEAGRNGLATGGDLRGEAGRGSQGRATAGRTGGAGLPLPAHVQPPAVKIELEENPRSTLRPPLPDRRPPRSQATFLTPMKLVKWIVLALVLGSAFWWVVRIVRNLVASGGPTGTAP
jgi:serine/threonine-protein kinase